MKGAKRSREPVAAPTQAGGKPSKRQGRTTALFGVPPFTLLAGLCGVLLLAAVWFARSGPVGTDTQAPAAALPRRPEAGSSSAAACCSNAARAAVATKNVLQLTDELLALGPRVGGGANPLGDGYFQVLELLATRPATLPYASDLEAECPCLGDAPPSASRPEWTLSWDNFTDTTPLGPKSFSNILWTFDPSQGKDAATVGPQRHIVLAAHWDSKLLPSQSKNGKEEFFVGACDSAVPVAMIATLMQVIQAHVWRQASTAGMPKFTVMFFDGEEAFVDWQGLDNTYGSRHLAKRWAEEHMRLSPAAGMPSEPVSLLSTISLFVLLDLIGPYGPTFRNFFPKETGAQYDMLRRIELKLRSGPQSPMKTNTPRPGKKWRGAFFPADPGYHQAVEDDHKHWQQRNVSVLDLIALPFPAEWHTMRDDRQAVDDGTVHDLMLVFEEFVKRLVKPAERRAN